MFTKKAILAGLSALAMGFAAQAERTELQQGAVYGIDESTGYLIRHDFFTDTNSLQGKIQLSSGQVLTGIQASAYRQGYKTLTAFWTNPSTNEVKVVTADLSDGAAKLSQNTLDIGVITGATAVRMADPNAPLGTRWDVYALQHAEKVSANRVKMLGTLNINPNNSEHNEFKVEFPDGTTLGLLDGTNADGFSRDDLKGNLNFDSDGKVYTGPASRVVIKPKGNGEQTTMKIDGSDYPVNNSKTYVFEGDMQIVVWNDHVNSNGKAMGHWWIAIESEGVVIDGEEKTEIINQLILVDPDTGLGEIVMPLDDVYDGLAGEPGGQTFYASKDTSLYKIDVATQTTTLLSTMHTNSTTGLDKVLDDLLVYDNENSRIRSVNHSSGVWVDDGVTVDITGLGTIFYVDPSYDPERFDQRVSYD